MRRCVVVGGAGIANLPFIKKQIRMDDYFIFCDGGLSHVERLGVQPDLIVGDFDSHVNPHWPIETIVLPCEKDDTDTGFAVKTALARGFSEFLFLGATGGRLDHTLGNLALLLFLHDRGKKAYLADDFSLVSVAGKEPVSIESDCAYFSLLCISGTARGVQIENAKYPLSNATIDCSNPYGVSNEVLPGKTAVVRVTEGNLLLIKVYQVL